MQRNPLIITVRNPKRRNREMLDAFRSGVRLRAKTWSGSGRPTGSADRRSAKNAIRRGDW